MSKDDLDILAGEYVLGILGPEERRRFEQRLESNPLLRERVARWETVLGRLNREEQTATPPDLWSRLKRALDQETSAWTFHTIRMNDGEWMSIRPGLERKVLYRDPETGAESYLFRMEPGALIEGHHHAHAEECLVLEGDLTIGDLRLNAGDYHVAARGSIHPVLSSQGGAVMFVRGAVL